MPNILPYMLIQNYINTFIIKDGSNKGRKGEVKAAM